MSSKKRVLLKLTGEIFLDQTTKQLSPIHINQIIGQIKELSCEYLFGIVVGGGNFFRGNHQGKTMSLSASVGHQIGMLATMMNGLMLKDLLEQHGIPTDIFCAMPSPEVGNAISQQTIGEGIDHNRTLVFTGGTGNPFFTTDTNAILRSLQINASEIWKGTNIDGVYDSDPRKNTSARKMDEVTYSQALSKELGIMDLTAYALADTYGKTIRVFNIFSDNALLNAAHDNTFGSRLISRKD